ncbi:MAG: TIGR04086 family membrane protein [Oscillospiraceae bacterium]|nr:TIGR04086 family membrane protein [Oscillospiraceae bacterium]
MNILKRLCRDNAEKLMTAAVSVLACLGTVFLCMLFCSWLTVRIGFPDEIIGAMSGFSLCCGCFAGAYTAGSLRRKGGLALGFMFGGIVFLVLLILSALLVRGFTAGGAAAKAAMIAVCSAAGGVLGANRDSFSGMR